MVLQDPLQFHPLFRSYLWGGDRLANSLHKPTPGPGPWAESWELVDHGPDQSTVAHGPLQGISLQQLLQDHPHDLLGPQAPTPHFPLLLKYLDCHRDLSLQVHPNDDYAARMPSPDLGKTEAWYILHAEPGAKLYAGLQPNLSRADLQHLIDQDRLLEAMHVVEPKPDQCFFIPAGTVHALGAGLVVAEIQQASDTTFRLYDWGRLDANGQPRPLHLQQALDVIDFQAGPVHPATPTLLPDHWEQLVLCPYFQLLRWNHPQPCHLTPDHSFKILTVTRGHATLNTPSQSIHLPTGASVLLPASHLSCQLQFQPNTNLLLARLPDSNPR